jgi:hypothetical protein
MPLKKLGIRNSDWGVCGFTSCLYGLWDVLDKSKRSQLHGGTKTYRLLAEIKTYLVMLQAEGETKLLNDIQTFCRKFGEPDNDFGSFTVEKYISLVNGAVSKSENQIKSDANYGIGMPPQAVVDYLQRMWEFNVTLKPGKDFSGPENGIIGVKNADKPLSTLYDGLEHYMYRHNQKIYSWGDSFDNVTQAAKAGANGVNWEICCLIPFK